MKWIPSINVFMPPLWLTQNYVKLALASLALGHGVGLPTGCEMNREQVHSEASACTSQPSNPAKEKDILVQMLACHLLLCASGSP